MAYEWIQGVSQCWPPGTKCEVWWDAWAVVVAALSLGVAVLTMVVTAGSAVAVFMLGRAANRLASASESREGELRRREARVLAGYLLPELRQALSRTSKVLSTIEGNRSAGYVRGETRAALRLQLEAPMPLTSSVMDRLHVLPAAAGDYITDALANISLAFGAALAFEKRRGDIDDDVALVVIDLHAQHAYDALTAAQSELRSILASGK